MAELDLNRRQLIVGATAFTVTSPAIVQATSIMRIRSLPQRFLLNVGFLLSGGGVRHIIEEIESTMPLTESRKAQLMGLAKALLPDYASPSNIFAWGWQLLDDPEPRYHKKTFIYR